MMVRVFEEGYRFDSVNVSFQEIKDGKSVTNI